MRIVLIVPIFPQISETFIVRHFLGLLDRGWDAHILCQRRADENWTRMPLLADRPSLRQRVHVTRLPKSPVAGGMSAAVIAARTLFRKPSGVARYVSRKGASPRERLRAFYLDARLIELAPDVVHFEFGALAVGRERLGERLNARLVVSFRGYDLNFAGLGRPGYYDELWRHVDGIHVLGDDLLRRARRRGCPVDIPYARIPPAIDPQSFSTSNRAHHERVGSDVARPLRIVSVGRLEWKKGYEYALTTVAALAGRGVHVDYRIVGEGRFREALELAIRQLGLGDRVQLLGALPAAAVRAELGRADVFLHAAVSEGFCNAVLEAQSMQLPVVTSDADGLGENVADGVTGFVRARRDVASTAKALARLAEDPGLRQRMGTAGRERVLTSFDPTQQLDEFDRFYRRVLAAPARTRP